MKNPTMLVYVSLYGLLVLRSVHFLPRPLPSGARGQKCQSWYLVAMGCVVMLTGCAMQGAHYKSILRLHNESAVNYSQQVLDTIASVRDEAKLPVFFRVEGATSSWTPSYDASVSASLPVPTGVGTEGFTPKGVVTPGFGGGETYTNIIQYNDFGSAAMSRIDALFGFLCFPIHFDGLVLPNGTLYTIVDETTSRDHLLLWTKTRNGGYLGVTPVKNENFLKFAHDVTYWTQTASPDPRDLASVTGSMYRFFSEYVPTEVALAKAVLTKPGAQTAVDRSREALQTQQRAFDALKEESKMSTTAPAVLQTLLTLERDVVQSRLQAVDKATAQLKQVETDIKFHNSKLQGLFFALQGALSDVKANDPDASDIDIEGIIAKLTKRREILLSGDQQQIEQILALELPRALGQNARETVDELYRERFESLPLRLEPQLQGTQ